MGRNSLHFVPREIALLKRSTYSIAEIMKELTTQVPEKPL